MLRAACKSALVLAVVTVLVGLSGTTVLAGFPHAQSGGSSPSSSSGFTPDGITAGNAVATTCVDVDTCTTPALADVDAGDTLIVIVTEHTTTAGNPSSVVEVTSGGNNALTLLGSSGCTVLGHGVVAIYGLADVTAQPSVTFTVTYAADEYYTIHALDVEGAAASPFETAGTPVCSSAAGTTASASVTTTVADDLVILGVEVRADEAISATGGDSVVTLEEIAGTDSDSGSMLDENDSDTGSITLSATFGSAQWAALAIALKPGLIPGTVSPATAAIDAAQTIALTSTDASGGSGSYTYQWYNGSATCSAGTAIPGATTLVYTTPALPVGTDYYCVEFTDSVTSETVYSNVAVITVNPTLSVVVDPASPSIDVGQSITLTAEPSGGTGVDTYLWYAGTSCSGSSLALTPAYTTPALSATTTYCVAVTDSSYSPVTVNATDTVSVSSASLRVTITPSAPIIDPGQSITLTAEPSGGTGADAYAWYSGGVCSGPVLATTASYDTPALTSNATYCVAVTDSAYEPVTASANDTVTVASSALSVSISPQSPSIDRGQSITLTAHPVGGTGPDSYAWYSGTGCSGTVLARGQSYTTSVLDAPSTYCVEATDSAFQPVSATATDTVSVSGAPLTVTITPAEPSVVSGHSINLTAEPSGGTGADTYAWYAGASCSGPVLASTQTFATPALAGDTTYCVAVTDSSSEPATALANATVTVTAATVTTHGGGGSGSMSLLGSLWWLLLLLAVAVLLIIIVVAGRRRRKKEPPSPLDSGPTAVASGVGATPAVESPSSPEAPTASNDSAATASVPENPASEEIGVGPLVSEPSPPGPVEPGTSSNGAPPAPEPSPGSTTPSPAPGTESTPVAEPASDPVAPSADSPPTPPATEEPAPGSTPPAPDSSPQPKSIGDWLFDQSTTEGEGQP